MGYSSVRGTSSVNRWLILVVVLELRVGARQAGALLNLRRGFLSWPVEAHTPPLPLQPHPAYGSAERGGNFSPLLEALECTKTAWNQAK